MVTRLSPRDVERSINDASASVWWYDYSPGVGGWARFGFIRLRSATTRLSSRYRPVLAGRIEPHQRGSRLRLRYRAPLAIYTAFLFWCLGLGLVSPMVVAAEWAAGLSAAAMLAAAALLLASLAVPVVLLLVSIARTDRELEELIHFLECQAEARVVRSLLG